MEREFEHLRGALTSDTLLVIFDPDKPIELHTDASDQGIRAVLAQRLREEERPVAFFLKKPLPHQTRYTIAEKECLAVIKHFEAYFLGASFKVVTDHRGN